MLNTYLRVKGIIKKDDRYLLIKRWVDDRIPDPFVWEFIDAEVNHGEAPDDTVKRAIRELLSIEGNIEKIEYTDVARPKRVSNTNNKVDINSMLDEI